MAQDLGKRHICFNCQAKFYDLLREEAVCPKCGSPQPDKVKSPPPAKPKGPRGKKPLQEFDDFDHDTPEENVIKEEDIPLNIKTEI